MIYAGSVNMSMNCTIKKKKKKTVFCTKNKMTRNTSFEIPPLCVTKKKTKKTKTKKKQTNDKNKQKTITRKISWKRNLLVVMPASTIIWVKSCTVLQPVDHTGLSRSPISVVRYGAFRSRGSGGKERDQR